MGLYRTERGHHVRDDTRQITDYDSLEAQATAAGVAFLAVSDEGAVLAHHPTVVEMWGLVPEVLATGTALQGALETGDESAKLLARVLSSDDVPGRGEVTLPDDRAIEWGVAETAGGRAKIWTFRDVSRERSILSSLRDAENWLRLLGAHADGLILELDTAARIVGVWASDSTLFGQPESALHGRTLREVLDEPHGAYLDERVRAAIESGRPESFECTVGAGAQRRVYAANSVLIPAHEGYAARVTVLIRDVTERIRLQHQVLQSERLASLGVLAAGVAHEINNPLGYMLINLERVRRALVATTREQGERLDAAELVNPVELAIEGTTQVQRIVNDLRYYSRSGQEESLAVVDVRRVLEFTLEMTRSTISERARVRSDLGEVPAVLASAGRLHQVLLNLVTNAVQAIPEGAPNDHEVRVSTSTDARGRAVIEIGDTGAGISDAQLGEIFDPFFTTKAPGVGTGLGLSICQNIVTSFGGQITVESAIGAGSVFRVILPARPDP